MVACFPKAACLARLNADASARLGLTTDLARQVMTFRASLTLHYIHSARERVLAFLIAQAGDDGSTIVLDGLRREIASAIGSRPRRRREASRIVLA